MANSHETLTSLFTDIANAIREKTGEATSLVADNFPANIRAIKGGFPNGTEWTQSNITNGIFDAIYNANGIWVAAGTGLYYSTNGKVWTKSNVTSGTFDYVYNADGIWVARSTDIGLWYSTDGITWTQSNVTSGTFDELYNADGMWILTGYDGTYYSTDGKTWTQNDTVPNQLKQVCKGNGIWVATTRSYSSSFGGLYYSLNGITWTQSNFANKNVNYICYANGIWMAGTSAGIERSTDGKTWTEVLTLSSSLDSAQLIDYANGIWVAGVTVSFKGYIYYSTDGKTWTNSDRVAASLGNLTTLRYENGIWIAIGQEGAGLCYSTNGMNWVKCNITTEFTNNKLYYTNGVWICGKKNDEGDFETYYSIDAKNWTFLYNKYLYGIYNANGIWVASFGDGLWYSVTWEAA